MSSSPESHKNQGMVKAHTFLEFALDNLELLLGHQSISPNECPKKIFSLFEDLKHMRTFVRRVQENHYQNPTISDLVADIVHEVGEFLVSSDLYVRRYIIKRAMNFEIGTSSWSSPDQCFLLPSEGVADLIKAIKSLKEDFSRFLSRKAARSNEMLNSGSSHGVSPRGGSHEAMAKARTTVDLALKDVEKFLRLKRSSTAKGSNELVSLRRDLMFIRSSIKMAQENSALLERVVDVVAPLMDMRVQCHDDCLVFCAPKIPDLIQKIKYVENEVLIVLNDGGADREGRSSCADTLSSPNANIAEEKAIIGMEDETTKLLNRLIGGGEQLEVIPVIGMAGIGKTTLARKLHNDPSTACHFHIRAWTSVSQSYQNRKLLHDILSSIIGDEDPIFSSREEDIGEKLYRCLKGRRYLIVLDDVWNIEVWKALQIYLPKDGNSSRVIVTSRNKDVLPKELISENPPHLLRLLTEGESWDLFRCKVFGSMSFSEELMQVGKEIVATCKGLPIAIAVIGGLLAKEEKTKEKWTEVAKTIRSSANTDFEHLMDILALSYKHLSFPLKSCFLYLGSFPEDYEFPVKWLIRSWMAQGFIEPTAGMELEDVAEGYVMNLIDRNLLTVVKRRSDGGIKSCQIHDLLRELSMKKAGEKKFLQPICRCGSNAKSSGRKPDSFSDCQYFHFYNSHVFGSYVLTETDSWTIVESLRVLDLRRVCFYTFPEKIFELLHLKYLALQIDHIEDLPHSLFELWYLETFILDGEKGGRVELVPALMKMKRLRHFHISAELFCDPEKWWLALDHRRTSMPDTILENLQTISTVSASDSQKMTLLTRTPNLRKLGLRSTLSMTNKLDVFPTLSNLKVLETLKFEYQTFGMTPFTIRSLLHFPENLKKLALIGSHVDWSEISIIARLPNLEVLKLKDNFFSGPKWETSDDGFQSLKFLKLSHMDLEEWVCSSGHFPKLEQLVLNGCLELDEIPLEIGDVMTLQEISVYRSSENVVESAKQIQETQSSLGNYDFRVSIFQYFQEH